jgi:hypothetical protein
MSRDAFDYPTRSIEIVPYPDAEPIVRYRGIAPGKAMEIARDLKRTYGSCVYRVQVRNERTGFVCDEITTDLGPQVAKALAVVRKALGRD